MEHLHPYLRYEEGRGEDMWVPALVRAHHEGYAHKTSTRHRDSKCKFCLASSHYNWECENPHALCQHTGGSLCRIYPSHANVALGWDTICPFKGQKIKANPKGKQVVHKPSWGQAGSQEGMMSGYESLGSD